MQYTAKGTHNRYFELFDDHYISLGTLDYTHWFSFNAAITLSNGDTYQVAPSNFWQTSMELRKNDVVFASVRRNWTLNVIVQLHGGAEYYFTGVGLLNRHYALMSDQEKEMVALRPDFQWSKLSFNYDIETDDNYPEVADPALILFLIYCCNFLHGHGAGAVVAASV